MPEIAEKVSMLDVIDMELESLQEGLMTDAGLTQKHRELMQAQIAILDHIKLQHQDICRAPAGALQISFSTKKQNTTPQNASWMQRK